MKLKDLSIIILSFLIIFSSCKKNNDDVVIIGTWDYNNVEISMSPTNIQLAGALQMGLSFYKPDEFSLTFNDDKTLAGIFDIHGHRQTLSGTYIVSDENLNINIIPASPFDIKYSLVNQKRLTISYTFTVYEISLLMNLLKQVELEGYDTKILEMLPNSLAGVDTIAFSLHFYRRK